MIAKVLVFAAAACVATAAFAQDPYAVAPQAYKKQFENDSVRVTRVHYAPNERIAEHEHPARPTIYIYLKDGGPVLFKHEHGESGDYAATRGATKAGGYRLAAGRAETHVVENRSDLPSDFLQVELKIPVDAKTFTGRRLRNDVEATEDSSKVEVDIAQLRITRVTCVGPAGCTVVATGVNPALVVALGTGDATWVAASSGNEEANRAAGEYLVIEFKNAWS